MYRRTSEELLKDSEHRYRSLVELSPEAIAVQSEGDIVYINNAGIELLGATSSQQIVGEPILNFIHPDCHEMVEERMRRIRENKRAGFVEQRWVRVDGQVIDVEIASAPITYSGRPASQIVFRNITDRKQDELVLKESERRFRQLFDQSADILIVHDEKGRIQDCNVKACRAHGYDREEMLSLSLSGLTDNLLSEEERKKQERAGGTLWQRTVKNEENTFGSVHFGEHKRRDGTTFPVEVRLGGVDYGGRRMILASIRDIAEQKGIEESLRESEERYRLLVEASPEPIVVHSEGLIVYMNLAGAKLYGAINPEELVGHQALDFVHPDYKETVRKRIRDVLQNNERAPLIEEKYIRLDGSVVDVEVTGTAITYRGEPAVQVMFRDITERKRTENALRESEERFRTLVRYGSDVISVLELGGTIRYESPAAERVLGYRPEEMVGNSAFDYIHPDDYERLLDAFLEGVATDRPIATAELRFRHADGSWRDMESIGVNLLNDPSVQGIIVNSRDITGRKRAEEKLRKQEERLRRLIEQAADALFVHDLQGNLIDVNQQVCESLGYTREELLSMTVADIEQNLDSRGLEGLWNEVLSRGPLTIEGIHRRKEGAEFPVEVRIGLFEAEEGQLMLATARDITERKQAEKDLQESEQRFRTIFEQSAMGISIADPDRRFLETNVAYQRLTGYGGEELYGKEIAELSHPDDVPEDESRNEKVHAGDKDRYQREKRYIRKDGAQIWVRPTISVVRDANGEPEFLIGMVEDITERKQAEKALEQSEKRYRSVVERTADGLFLSDFESNQILETNAALQSMLGYSSEELIRMTLYDFIVDSKENIDRNAQRVFEERQSLIGERRYRRKDGEVIDVEVSASVIPYGGKEVSCGIVRDVTERKAMERELTYRAFRDPLTGLPNRTLLEDRLKQAVVRADRSGEQIAVMFLDLDNFKVINDSLGHKTGDELLVAVGRRLQSCLRPSDTVARLGGDEFTILLDVDSGVEEARQVAGRILDEIRIPIVLQGKKLSVNVSIGIAIGGSGELPEDLLRDADLAMYRAKFSGKAHYEVFLPSMHEEALERLNLEDELRRSVERGELEVCYQPRISLNTGRIIGTEALVRWEHPERGLIMPNDFIPFAEETGLINELGRWTLEESCRKARDYGKYNSDDSTLTVSVNLSVSQLQQPSFVEEVSEILQRTGLDPRDLILEITESVIMGEPESNVATLKGLKELGVELAIDDFGTGYSSLSYLSRFPIDSLKVDRSFVAKLKEDSDETIIVSSVVALAHSLRMEVLAEGVETVYQLARLRELGCDQAQGNYFSGPVTHREILALLDSGPRW